MAWGGGGGVVMEGTEGLTIGVLGSQIPMVKNSSYVHKYAHARITILFALGFGAFLHLLLAEVGL